MSVAAPLADRALWHDLECGAYVADLPLWRELAAAARGPVLDVGAGTGRVTLELARAGHEVLALDHDPVLLAVLRARAAGLPVRTVVADARDFALGRRFPLVLAPMQTVQLLGGAEGRAAFLARAAAHLASSGLLAVAIAEAIEPVEPDEDDALPLPDIVERDGWLLASQPLSVREQDDRVRPRFAIERRREAIAPDGTRASTSDVVWLDRLSATELEAEGAAAGLRVEPARVIGATAEHVASQVVLLRA